MHKILFAASEAHPLIKTGGLGDVAGSLPIALSELGQDVRLVLPAYREALAQIEGFQVIAAFQCADTAVRILESQLPGSPVPVWLVDAPHYFDRPGGPYLGPDGRDWPDNAARFAVFARAVTALALGRAGLAWLPDLVHCNDWQTGLIPALLSLESSRPATVFTLHNLAYQGLFSREIFELLGLPVELWDPEAMEFHGQFSFIKGGLVYADQLTTVSPSYAEEIRTPALGYGLEGLLNHRSHELSGILNGADYTVWDPSHDPFIVKKYDSRTLHHKALNKADLQQRFELPVLKDVPLIGMIGRLVEQKGVDLLLAILPQLLRHPVQLVLLGSGEDPLEQALQDWANAHPERIAVHLGYSEDLAHRIEAGADMFLMPSRFEPCGLNQMYSLRYGTAPIVRRTGGLADTVMDANEETLAAGTATGFVFNTPTPQALLATLLRALSLFTQTPRWQRLVKTGMAQDFSWQKSARQYLDLYDETLHQHAAGLSRNQELIHK